MCEPENTTTTLPAKSFKAALLAVVVRQWQIAGVFGASDINASKLGTFSGH